MKPNVSAFLAFRLSFFSLVFFALSVFTRAQSNAVLSGRVTDLGGAAIAGAQLLAEPAAGGPQRVTSVSHPDGSFSLALPAGRYRVAVSSRQMSAVQRQFTLRAGEHLEWNVRMQLEPLSSRVVVSAEAEPAPANTVAAPATVFTGQDIAARQAIFLAPLLASAPGASMARLGPLGGVSSFFLDGGNSNFTKFLVDGAAVNEPGGDIDLSDFDLTNIDKIEVVHGAASALFGSDAVDGVVELFTREGATREPALTLIGEGGTFESAREEADLSGVVGHFSYAPAVSYFDSDGQGPNDRFRQTTLSGNFGWKFGDSDQLRLSLRNSASDAGQPGQTLLEPPLLGQSSDLHDSSANLSWDFSAGAHWENHLAASNSYFHNFIIDIPAFTEVNEFNRTAFEAQSTYLDGPLAVSLGYHNEVENGSAAGPHERRNNQAGYLETHYQFGRRLTAIAGLRAEDNAVFGTRVVPRTGVAYLARYGRGFWGQTRLRASWGLGIKEPDFEQSYENDPCFPGNPHLAPERSDTFNAGIDQTLAGERVKFSQTFFRNEYYDIVSFASCFPGVACGFPVPSACTPADEQAEGGFGTFFNTDAARAYGAETTVEARPLGWLSVVANYTYDNTLVLKSPNAFDPTLTPGNRLFLRPLDSANLILNAAFRRLDVNLAGDFVGRSTDSDFLGLGFARNPGYFRVDLGTQFAVGRGFTVLAHAENLLDRRYSDAVGYPALGLNYLAGLKYTWGGR